MTLLASFVYVSSRAASDPVVVEVTDATMSQVYYHQTNFTVPTKLVFTNLTSVSGNVYFHQTQNLVEVDFPALTSVSGYVYFHGNTALQTISMPALNTVNSYLYVMNNTSLTTLDVCALQQILPQDDMLPYYAISGNTPSVDVSTSSPACFSLGGPANLALSGNTVAENEAVNTLVGTLSADSNYPSGTLTYLFNDMAFPSDNSKFTIVGNQLRTNAVFDYEAAHTYTVSVRVFNQLGETITQDFTVSVTDVVTENLTVIEIPDATLDNVYYHQVSFAQPTKLVFTNSPQ